MRKRLLIMLLAAALVPAACAPVLDRSLMEQGLRNVPLDQVREHPDQYAGKLFILGGIIVETKVTAKGSLIEALAVPVSSSGRLQEPERADGRFLALYPGQKGLLDPIIYRQGREVTLAGDFIGLREGKIGEMEYRYPLFEVREIYLWEEGYFYAPYDPWYYPYPYWWYDPWWRRYPPPRGW